MRKSTSLGLYLFFARYWRFGPNSGPATGTDPRLPAPELPTRPSGQLIWFHADATTPWPSLAHLARQMARARPGLCFLLTGQQPPDIAAFPAKALTTACPVDQPAALRAFLDHFRPELVLLTGLALPPALIHVAHARQIPLVLADVQLPRSEAMPWRWPRGMARVLLARFQLILTRDSASAGRIERFCGQEAEVVVTGRIEDTTEPLPHAEAERTALAEILHNRPVWLAAACPPDEEEAVVAAHSRAMRYAHRILLILSPADPANGPALAARLIGSGLNVALRSRDEDPEDEIEVLVADLEGEMGLWYRLAPLTYMGGTLTPAGTGRSPYEPAALGSAIIHGAHPGPYPEAYASLADAFAARRVDDAEALTQAVSELIAPDKAAYLAHNAWAAASGGAEVTERVMRMLFDQLPPAVAQS